MADKKANADKTQTQLAVLKGGAAAAESHGFKILGETIWWRIKNVVIARDDLLALLDKHGLDKGYVPKAIRVRSAVLRTLDALAEDGLLERIIEDPEFTVFQWSDRNVDKDRERAEYREKVVFKYWKKEARLEASEPLLQTVVDALMIKYGEAFLTQDVRGALTNLLYSKHGMAFSLKEEGGIYFVPDEHRDFVDRLQALIKDLGPQCNLRRLAIPNTPESQEEVGASYVDSFMRDIATLRGEIAKLEAAGTYRNDTLDKKRALLMDAYERAKVYMQMVSIDAKDIGQQVNALEQEILSMYRADSK